MYLNRDPEGHKFFHKICIKEIPTKKKIVLHKSQFVARHFFHLLESAKWPTVHGAQVEYMWILSLD